MRLFTLILSGFIAANSFGAITANYMRTLEIKTILGGDSQSPNAANHDKSLRKLVDLLIEKKTQGQGTGLVDYVQYVSGDSYLGTTPTTLYRVGSGNCFVNVEVSHLPPPPGVFGYGELAVQVNETSFTCN